MPRKTKKANRRNNNEGSIYQRKDGKWCGQVLIRYNEQGKPVRKTYYGATKTEVVKKVNEATHQIFAGTAPVEEENVKVEQLMLDFLWIFKKPVVADVTFEWHLNICNTYIIPQLGKTAICDVNPVLIQSLINHLYSQKNLSLRTVKAVRDLLNQAFNHAVELKMLLSNPVSSTKLPKASRVKSEQEDNEKVIPRDDRIRILNAAESDVRMKTAITVLLFTGMRIGEFLALPWRNVDFINGSITIDRAITVECEYGDNGVIKNRKTVVGSTKTQCSNRSFKVPPVVIDVLRDWREALPDRMRRKPNHDILAPDAVVFPNDMGEMRTYSGFRTTYRRFMSENGLGTYSLHTYRHTFATMLLEAGVNPKIVQKLLGHRDIETTLGIYSHILAEVYDGVADTMTGIHEGMLQELREPMQTA